MDVTPEIYGQYGRFLAHLSSLSLLSIRSRCPHDPGYHRLILQRGQVVHRQVQVQDDDLQGYGTNIQVYGLFAHLPVRSRQNLNRYGSPREVQKEFDNLKKLLVRYLLARHGTVSVEFSVQDGSQHFMYRCPTMAPGEGSFLVESIVSILHQANFVPRLDATSWKLATLRMTQAFIRAAFSLDPSPSKSNQFISLGIVPVHSSLGGKWLYDLVNDKFDKSTYGDALLPIRSSSTEDHLRQPRGRPGSKVDRWPMFNICIDISADIFEGHVHPELLSTNTASMRLLSQALDQLVSQFLVSHGFKTRPTYRNPDSTMKILSQPQGRIYSPTRETRGHRHCHSHLQHWHRIKSGRHLGQERGDHALPFTKHVHLPASPGLTVKEQTTNDSAKENEPSQATSMHLMAREYQHHLGNDQIAEVDDSAIRWIDPQTDQSTRICSRTGATLDLTTDLSTTGRDRGCSRTSLSRQRKRGKSRSRTADEVSTLLRRWGTKQGMLESPLPRLSDAGLDGNIFNAHHGLHASSGLVNQLPKTSLSCAEVLGQVDGKFLLAVAPIRQSHPESAEERLSLLVIDQHAADERIKLENLCCEFFATAPVTLAKPLVFEVDHIEADLFEKARDYFSAWHLCYSVERFDRQIDGERGAKSKVITSMLPISIAERCRAEPGVLVELLRREIWKEEEANYNKPASIDVSGVKTGSWIPFASQCPSGILELLKSRSCRTAIMFNDILDKEQGQQLVDALSACDLPFQCAHGRPTMAIVAELDSKEGVGLDGWVDGSGQETVGFGVAWRGWKRGARD